MVLLKIRVRCFNEIFFSEREFLVFPHCEKWLGFFSYKNFSEIKFRQEEPDFHMCEKLKIYSHNSIVEKREILFHCTDKIFRQFNYLVNALY